MDNKLDLFYRDLGMAFLHLDVDITKRGRSETTGPRKTRSARQRMLRIKTVPPDSNT